jgi:hypothetical protein
MKEIIQVSKKNDLNINSDNKYFEVLVALGREKVNRTKSLTAEKAESSSNNYDEYEGNLEEFKVSNLEKIHQKVDVAMVVESCFLVDSNQIKMAHSKKSVKWATQLEILFYDPLQKCDQMETENTLILNDMPNIVLNGSLSRNAPRWSLGSLADSGIYHQNQTETGISLIECSVVMYSQLYGLTAIPNHAYEKKLEIVYTLNDWKTVVSLPLVYHSSPDFKTDLFQFHIDLQTILPLSTLFKFCFKYTYGLDSMIIFENNHAKNFSLPLSVALPPHSAKMQRKSKIKTYSWKAKKMISLMLQDSFNVPPPRSMVASYSLSYAF